MSGMGLQNHSNVTDTLRNPSGWVTHPRSLWWGGYLRDGILTPRIEDSPAFSKLLDPPGKGFWAIPKVPTLHSRGAHP